MVDDVKNIAETAESKAQADAIDRARLARERREAEQRKRLDELRAHAAAAQAQREKRDDDRRRRQQEQRARDDDRRQQVEDRKRAIWEASISRREALLQREKDRTERLERARVARSSPRPAFAFGSSTPRLLEPLDSGGFFWAARRAASTTNVMFASAPLTRRASALQLDSSDTDNKDEPERSPMPLMWSSVARRRTDLVPTMPAPRAPGRAYSMTRLDRLPGRGPLQASPSLYHLNRTQCRSGETTPSRPASALSQAAAAAPRRAHAAPRRPRPASIAGTGVNTPRGGPLEAGGASAATTPCMSRDSSVVGAEAPRRPHAAPRRPRPSSVHAPANTVLPVAPGDGKPPVHRKPKPSKDHDKPPRGKSMSASPGRPLSPAAKEHSVDKETPVKGAGDKRQVSAVEVTQKLEALRARSPDKVNENKENVETNIETNPEQNIVITADTIIVEVPKPVENKETQPQKKEEVKPEKKEEVKPEKKEEVKPEKKEEVKPEKKEEVKPEKREEVKPEKHEEVKENKKEEERKESAQEKTDDSDMTASMTAKRITTEEEAKAALAERRRRAREELERQAERERRRLEREAEEEAVRQKQEEERQRREEEEARELAALQRQMQQEKLQKAIEAQQQLEREESERRVKEEAEKKARLKEEEEKRKAAEEAEKVRREEAEKEEKERLLRKQRVEAIMARTRLKKQAEEEKKQQEKPTPAADNGNAVATDDLLGLAAPQAEESKPVESPHTNNGNDAPHAPAARNHSEEIHPEASKLEPSTNGNHVDFATHNGHHPLTLHNAI